MPKLSVIGTNDPYWVLDALNLYWDDLAKPNYVLYVPNSGHSLDDQDRTIAGVTGFYRYIASGQPLPKLEWSYHQEGDNLYLQFSASQKTAQPAYGSRHRLNEILERPIGYPYQL